MCGDIVISEEEKNTRAECIFIIFRRIFQSRRRVLYKN